MIELDVLENQQQALHDVERELWLIRHDMITLGYLLWSDYIRGGNWRTSPNPVSSEYRVQLYRFQCHTCRRSLKDNVNPLSVGTMTYFLCNRCSYQTQEEDKRLHELS